jgi:hypothetical protein
MTSPQSLRNQRWRRTVVTLAVLAVGLCWWYDPRADARFVGRWKRFLPHHNELGAQWFEFDADGGGSCGSNDIPVMHFTWSVEGAQLTIQYGRFPGFQGLAERLLGLIFVANPSRYRGSQRFFVSDVTENRIVWQPLLDGQITPVEGFDVFEMIRIPRTQSSPEPE